MDHKGFGNNWRTQVIEFRPRWEEGELCVEKLIDGILTQEMRLEEEALTTTVIDVLRSKGYTVIAPTKETN